MATITNTLAVCGLDKTDFSADWITEVKDKIASKVRIVHWAPLPSFGRILAVFETANDASQARLIIRATKPAHVRAYYAENTKLELGEKDHLQLPDAGRLWLISPPASPPAGWEQVAESEPNRETHFDPVELHEALSLVSTAGEPAKPSETTVSKAEPPASTIQDVADSSEASPASPGFKPPVRRMTLHEPPKLTLDTSVGDTAAAGEPQTPSPHRTPTIVVEWEDDDNDQVSPSTARPALVKTERPPIEA